MACPQGMLQCALGATLGRRSTPLRLENQMPESETWRCATHSSLGRWVAVSVWTVVSTKGRTIMAPRASGLPTRGTLTHSIRLRPALRTSLLLLSWKPEPTRASRALCHHSTLEWNEVGLECLCRKKSE